MNKFFLLEDLYQVSLSSKKMFEIPNVDNFGVTPPSEIFQLNFDSYIRVNRSNRSAARLKDNQYSLL